MPRLGRSRVALWTIFSRRLCLAPVPTRALNARAPRVLSSVPGTHLARHVAALETATRDPSAWIREAAAVAFARVPADALEVSPEPEPATNAATTTEPRAESTRDVSSSANASSFADRTPAGPTPFEKATRAVAVTERLDALAALLSDDCGEVRLAATRAVGARRAAARGHLAAIMPNLGAADATLREATLAALANIWKEDERRWAAVTPPDARRHADGDGTATFVAPAKPDERDSTTTKMETNPGGVVPASDASTATPAAVAPVSRLSAPKTPETLAELGAMTLTADLAAPSLLDVDGGVREACCELMGHLREAATSHVDALMERMNADGEDAVRDAAIDALTRLGYYNPLTGRSKSKGFYRDRRKRAGSRLGPDGNPSRVNPRVHSRVRSDSKLGRRFACGGRTTSVSTRRAFARGTARGTCTRWCTSWTGCRRTST